MGDRVPYLCRGSRRRDSFRPPGKIETLQLPEGPGIRNDAGVYAGAEVPVFYDPMISKLAAWGADRAEAIDRMRRALSEFVIAGELTTNLEFHRWLMNHPRFLAGDFDTNFIAQEYHPGAAAEGVDHARTAAMFLAAIAAQRAANHSNGQAPARAAQPARIGVAQSGPLRLASAIRSQMRYVATLGDAEHEIELEEISAESFRDQIRRASLRRRCAQGRTGLVFDPDQWPVVRP